MSGTKWHWTERRRGPAGKRRRSHARRGFSLSEFVVGIAVAGLLLGSSITTMTVGFRIFNAARDQQTVSQILRHEMDALRLLTWREISEAGEVAIYDADLAMAAEGNIRFRVERRIEESRPGQYAVELKVYWRDAFGREREQSAWTLFTRNGIHGAYGQRS